MGVIQDRVTPEFKKWAGYCEKDSSAQVGTYDKPESYKAGAGDKNYTVFAKLYKEKTGINVQGQPWCDSFVDTVLIHLFGVDKARSLLGGFSAYTPTSASYFKQMGRYHKAPQEGDQLFFRNSQRIYHTGYVYKVDGSRVYTVEGNTSSAQVIENEGGCVACKSYLLSTSGIDGYGRPDYSIVEPAKAPFVPGWRKAADGRRWWYETTESGGYVASDWLLVNDHWYLFDSNGYMVTGWHRWDGIECDPVSGGQWFYLDETPGGQFEGACWRSDERGAQSIWKVSR